MQKIETTARSVEEAIELALRELDAERGEVEIDVVSRGKAGILGIGSEPAKVRVTRLEQAPDIVRVTNEILENLIGDSDDVWGLLQPRNPDLGGLAADAQNASFTPANDVYFDFAAFGVELP